MIIYMSDIICVTNRKLCTVPFLSQIENIAKAGPKAIILREKDMEEEEYYNVAKEVKEICEKYDVELIIHSFYNVALKLGIGSLHMPLGLLESISTDDKKKFTNIGASCHSKKDAVKAYSLGCTYIIAGHIFETDCKKGLPGRGISFLKNVSSIVDIPVYAIGGISNDNYSEVIGAGAAGACIMSSAMTAVEPKKLFDEFIS